MEENGASGKGQQEATGEKASKKEKFKVVKADLKKAGMAPWLAIVILSIFAGVLGLVCWGGICDANSPTLNLLIGALIALVGQVGQYYFGSSLGSKQKTLLLEAGLERKDQ